MIDALNQTGTRPIQTAATPRGPAGPDRLAAGRHDALELSEAARAALEPGGIRHELVQRVKAELAADNYLTDDKLSVAVDRLHARIFSQ